MVKAMNAPSNKDVTEDVRDSQIRPVAGIWECPNCGRHIQVIMDSATPEKQPFTCVCGTPMQPGDQYKELDGQPNKESAPMGDP